MSVESHTPNQGREMSSLQKDDTQRTESIANSDQSLLQQNTSNERQYRYDVEKSPSDHVLDRLYAFCSSLACAAVVVVGPFASIKNTADQTNAFVNAFTMMPTSAIAISILVYQVMQLQELHKTKVTINKDLVQGWAAWLGNHGPKWFYCAHSLAYIIALGFKASA